MQITKINNKPLSIKEYNGQRVLMFKDIDKAHGRPDGTAGRAFRSNRQHFIENTDYYKISPDEFRRTIGDMDKRQTNSVYVITESGYLMLAKSFTDDLAWTVQRQLVNCYFRCKEQTIPEQFTLEEPNYPKAVLDVVGYKYQDKTFNGDPVVTLNDIAYITGISADSLKYVLKTQGAYGRDYFKICGAQMVKFKQQNAGLPNTWNHLILVTKSGFMLLAKYYNLTKNTPQCFLTDNKPVVAEKPKQTSTTAHEPTKPTVDELIIALNVLRYTKYNNRKCAELVGGVDEYSLKVDGAIETVRKRIGMMLTV